MYCPQKAVSAFFEFDGDVNKLPLPKPAAAKALVQSVSVGPSTVDNIPMFSSSSGSSPLTLKIDGSSPKSPPAAFSPSSIAVARAQGITLLQVWISLSQNWFSFFWRNIARFNFLIFFGDFILY